MIDSPIDELFNGNREWPKDVDGDGIREVHCNSCEGAGAGLRTYLRVFRGVHKKYLARYVAVYQVMTNAKRISGRSSEICAAASLLRNIRLHEPILELLSDSAKTSATP